MNKRPLSRLAFIVALSFSMLIINNLRANDLSVGYIIPDSLQVCQTATFGVILENITTDTTKNINLNILLPNGITYQIGSVTGANTTELNTSNPQQPFFSVPDFVPSQLDTIYIDVLLDCGLVSAINSGATFDHTITVTYTGTNKIITTAPYSIETALLVISQVQPVTTSGLVCDDTITRTITIRNTRPAPLDTFYFLDVNSGNLAIAFNLGTPVVLPNGDTRLMLTGADFATIGDGDTLFELNEVIIIQELLTITACGGTVTSNLRAEWGCGGSICQFDNNIAAIGVNTCNKSAQLQFTPIVNPDVCYCADSAVPQRMIITNVGNDVAAAVQFGVRSLEAYHDFFVNAIDDSSFTMTQNGATAPLLPVFAMDMNANACFANNGLTDLRRLALLNLPDLAPGDSIVLDWNMYHCLDSCTEVYMGWRYDFRYSSVCPIGNIVADSLVLTNTQQFTSKSLPEYIVIDQNNSGQIQSFSYQFIDTSNVVNNVNNGFLHTRLELPCGMTWTNNPNDFVLGGQSPTSVNYNTATNTIEVVHTLPLSAATATMNYTLLPDCNAPCGVIDDVYFIDINNNVYLDANCNSASCRGINICGDNVVVEMDCQDTTCVDSLLGWSGDFYQLERINFGQPDNNNDGIPDATGSLNTNLVIAERAMVGDTIREQARGVIIDEYFQQSYDYARWHTLWTSSLSNSPLHSENSIDLISNTVIIYDSSSNITYTCPNVNYYTQVTGDSLHYFLEIDVAYLSSTGCLPASFRYAAGDSVGIDNLYKLRYNVADNQASFNHNPVSLNAEPNLRLGNTATLPLQHWYICDTIFEVIELSGYRVYSNIGSMAVRPCEPNDFSGLSSIQFFLAQNNFFPYEYREFASVLDLGVRFDPLFQRDSTRMVYAGIPNGSILLLDSDLPLDSLSADGVEYFDIDVFTDTLFDEGFYYFFQHIVNGDCRNTGFYEGELFARLQLGETLNDSIVNVQRVGSSIIRTLHPNLSHFSLLPNYVATNDTACWEFSITNNPNSVGSLQSNEAFNLWMQPTNADSTLTQFSIIDIATGQPLTSTNGIFTYGDLPRNATRQFRVCAVNSGCGIENLRLEYGWNCNIYTDPNTEPCYKNALNLSVESVRPELEMIVTSPSASSFPLCSTIPYHVAKVFNAELGIAKALKLQVILPQGLNIVTNSCEIAYPDGATFVNIPDPVLIAGNIYEWDVSALQPLLGANGLRNINEYPDNTFSIRMNVLAGCDFIGGSYLTFRASGENACGAAINNITRAGSPINISGAVPTYTTNIGIQTDTVAGCDNAITSQISITSTGATGSTDSVFVTLPPNITYQAGSYIPIANAPSSAPMVELLNGIQILKWQLNAGLSAGTTISFEFKTEGYSSLACNDELLLNVQTAAPASAFCVATNAVCNILVSTGAQQHSIRIDRAVLDITNLELEVSASGSQELIRRSIAIKNIGNAALSSQPITISYYYDTNGDGIATAADQLLHQETKTLSIAPNATVNLGLTGFSGFLTAPSQYCNIIAVIDSANNCICGGSQAIPTATARYTQPLITACAGQPINVGQASQAGYQYQWQYNVPQVNCDTCATTSIQLTNTTTNTAYYSYTQNVIANTGCETDYIYNIGVQRILEITLDSTSICLGDSTQLNAPTASNYQWTGQQISTPTAQNTFVAPNSSQWYQLTVTDNANCQFSDSVFVHVFAIPSAAAGSDQSICDNQSSTNLAAVYDPSYTYFWSPFTTLSNPFSHNPVAFPTQTTTYQLTVSDANGCTANDQMTVFVAQTPAPTTANIGICQGSSLLYNGQIFDSSGMYDFNLQSWNGCDSLHTLQLTIFDTTYEARNASICEGDSVAIGNEYFDSTGVYCRTFSSSNGCDSTICLTLTVSNIIQTQSDTILCDGDIFSWNNTNYTQSGNYAQTFTSYSGCDSIHSIQLDYYAPVVATTENVTLCQGDVYNYNNQTFGTAGTYAFNFSAWTGCDSLHTLILSISDTSLENRAATICEGDSVAIGNEYFNNSGIYCRTFTDLSGCDSTICLTLTVHPVYEITLDTAICADDSLIWHGEAFSEAGTYQRDYKSWQGCDSIHILNLGVYPPLVASVASDTTVALGQSIELAISGGNYYEWSPDLFLSCSDCANPTITPLEDVDYAINVRDENGCSTNLTVSIITINTCNEGKIGIPNAITPNGDGINDAFGVLVPFGIENFRMQIFNRWGQKVFETTDPNEKWNAKIHSRTQAQDAYVYLIEGNCVEGGSFSVKGSFLIAR